jgi:hypothetical protein
MEGAKAYYQDIQECIKEIIDKASKSLHPIKLQGQKSLTPEIFVSFLVLSHSDRKAGEYKKAYGGHRLALSDLMNQWLKKVLAGTPLVKKGSIWHNVKVPK